jgi:predicted dehydrogenase/threonine dehydrogenase-like Zn-dependent dehydrogenase
MKQVLLKAGKIIVDEVPPPIVDENGVLVANAFSLISSGTERGMVESGRENLLKKAIERPDLVKKVLLKIRQEGITRTLAKVKGIVQEPKPLGYSISGIAIEIGNNITDINVGDRVACGGAQSAYHSEIDLVTRNLIVKVPENVDMSEAAFATIGAIAMQGIRRAERSFGETIIIIGLGLLGNLGAQISQSQGYKVIGFDLDRKRVDLSKNLGIESYLLKEVDPLKKVWEKTDGFGADAVVLYVATDSSEPVNLAFDMCRQKGKVVLVGVCGFQLDREKMYRKELDFLISTSYGPGRYDRIYEEEGIDYPIGYVRWTENRNMKEFINLISQGKVKVKELISAILSVEEATKAYAFLESREKPLAVLLKYDYEKYIKKPLTERKVLVPTQQKKIEGKIGVGIIGAGSFVQGVHLPNLRNLGEYYQLRAVVTQHGEKAKFLCQQYRMNYATTDYKELLQDPKIDLVFIGTRHNLHYPMVIDAIKNGKTVFVEKPLCLTPEELENIKEEMAKNKMSVIVGFNRRYAPFITAIKQMLERVSRPYFVQYRVNAGFIPKDSWIQNPAIGRGRIVGEACHFFDLFNFLIGKDMEVKDIRVNSIPVDGKNIIAQDNFAISIRYSDGSLVLLTYTSLGDEKLPKERMEVFVSGKAFILNDYLNLEVYGIRPEELKVPQGRIKGNSIRLSVQDKGLKQELIELAKFMKGETSRIINLAEVISAMELTFAVDKAIKRFNNS